MTDSKEPIVVVDSVRYRIEQTRSNRDTWAIVVELGKTQRSGDTVLVEHGEIRELFTRDGYPTEGDARARAVLLRTALGSGEIMDDPF